MTNVIQGSFGRPKVGALEPVDVSNPNRDLTDKEVSEHSAKSFPFFIIPGFLQYIEANGMTPYIRVQAPENGNWIMPSGRVDDDNGITLNVSSGAITNLLFHNGEISFNTRFNGASQPIWFRATDVVAVFPKESPQTGFQFVNVFQEGDNEVPPRSSPLLSVVPTGEENAPD